MNRQIGKHLRTFATRNRRSASPGAFTLIELLVVVSIIALLLSVLVPVLRQARRYARQAVCLSNMTRLAGASMTYAVDDARNIMIPVPRIFGTVDPDNASKKQAPSTFEWGGRSGRGQGGALSIWGAYRQRGAFDRPLNRLLYKSGLRRVSTNDLGGIRADQSLSLTVFRCPADTGYTNVGWDDSPGDGDRSATVRLRESGLSAYDHYGNSYVANGFWVPPLNPDTGGVIPDRQVKALTTFLRPLSGIRNTSGTLLYREACARYAWRWRSPDAVFGECNLIDGGSGYTMGWHGQAWIFNACFADGHAAPIRMQGVQLPPPSLGSTYPDWPRPDGMTLYDYWKCLTLRGKDWQLDVLPSPPVDIGLKYNEVF